jgi:hypothetical protein
MISSMAGHVSRAMLSCYSHVWMDAKQRTLDDIATRQCAADENRQQEIERQRLTAVAPAAVVVQYPPTADEVAPDNTVGPV